MEGLWRKAVGNLFLFLARGHGWDITWRVVILHGHQEHLFCQSVQSPMHDHFPLHARVTLTTFLVSSTKMDNNMLST